MSTLRQAAGAVKAGNQIGGQWAPQMRAGAAGPPSPKDSGSVEAVQRSAELERIADERRVQFDRVAMLQSKIESERVALATELMSAKIEQIVGTHSDGVEIQEMVFEFTDQENSDNLMFTGLRDASGKDIELQQGHFDELDDYAMELGFYEHSTPYRSTGEGSEVTLAMVEPSLPSSDARPVGEYVNILDEASFNRALSDASNDGRIIGTVRTRSQFEEELRSHLAASANEMNTGDRDTIFDDGNIDAWVDKAVKKYEYNRSDEDADSRAFRDAIDSASPYEH